MDTNWCLACDCHFDGTGPYCSLECQNTAGPSFLHRGLSQQFSDDDDHIVYHHIDDAQPRSRWSGNDFAGILAWAAEVPPHGSTSPRSNPTTPQTASTTTRLPKLLRSNKRPAPPALYLTTPHPLVLASPSRPIHTQTQPGLSSRTSFDTESMGKTSLSGATESSLATPTSTLAVPIHPIKDRSSILGSIATHLRSVSPFIASPTSRSCYKRPVSPSTAKQNDPYQFTMFAHSRPSPTLDISYDSAAPVWKLSR